MRAGPIRIVLAGSDVCVRDWVRDAVGARPEMVVVGEVASGEQAISAVRELAPDVLVLDMGISGVHAIGVTRTALDLRPQLGIVVLIDPYESFDLPDEKARWMRHAGACCCVDTAADQAEIDQAILAAVAGRPFLSDRLAQRATLSPREHEILELIAAGWTNAQIARTLKITPATVHSHTTRICRKLRLAGRAEAAACGRELGLGHDMDPTTNLAAYNAAYHVKREEFYRAMGISH